MDLQKFREEFQKKAKPFREDRSGSNNVYGAFIKDDGTMVNIGRYVCHGWLQTHNHFLKSKDTKYILSSVMSPHATDEQLRRHTDWLVNRSPWAVMFVEKDVQSILDYGHVVSPDHPYNFVAAGLIASRFCTESYVDGYKQRVFVWSELLGMGCTEDEAYIFAHMFAPVSGNNYPVTFNRMSSGHTPFLSSNYQEDYIRNFLNHRPQNLVKETLRDCNGYISGGLSTLWGSSTSKDSLAEAIKRLIPVSKDKKKDHNIFRKAPSNGWTYSNRKDFASVIDQLKGILNA